MKRKTKATIVIIGILGIFGGIFGYFKFTEQMEKPVPEKEKAAVGYVEETSEDNIVSEKEKEKEKEAEVEYVEKTSEEIALEKQYPDDLPDYKMLYAIHTMSHQKVETDGKWGHEQITQAKIDRLLAIAKKNVNGYVYQEFYIEILERWSKGDFSHSVEDHNFVWEREGGTADSGGKATRLFTAEEEKEYVEQFFGNKQ